MRNVELQPIPTLNQLAELVRERMDVRRRHGPKWKFRVEPDLIVQLQPLLPRERTRRSRVIKEPLEFEGLAVEGEGIDAKAFDEPEDNRRIEFKINSDWTLYRRGFGPYLAPLRGMWRPEYPRPLTREQSSEYMAEHDARRIAHTASFAPLWNRIVAVLKGEFFTSLRPGALLGTACICCGRPLTDPISQARFIGPECYGSASKDARWIYILQPAQNVAVTRQSDELAELEEMLRTRLVIDIETRSSADLKKVGSAVYAQEPTTSITHVGYRNGQGGSHVWQPARSPMPSDLADALADDRATLVAHNVSFERAVLSGHAGRAIGIPPSINQLRRWSCTAARAAQIGLPRDLGQICRALSLPVTKDAEGHALMLRVSRPRTKSPLTWWTDDDRMSRIALYCQRDVDAETVLDRVLPLLSEVEQEVWLATERLNERGIRLDLVLLDRLIAIADAAKRQIDVEIAAATGNKVPKVSNHAALTRWLISQGLKVEGSSKDIVEELLDNDELDPTIRTVLELRQAGNGSSPRKTAAMARQLVQGRVHGALIYGGAPATLRWSSHGAQLQNLPRHHDEFDVAAILRDLADNATLPEIEDIHGPPLKVVSELLRPVLVATPGKSFVIGDYSQIEARTLAWLAGQQDRLAVFRRYDAGTGPDPYRITAGRIYHASPDEITLEQRQIGKTADLALGYQGGARAFKSMAKNFGLKIPTEQAEEIKLTWRAAHPNIENFWHELEAAACACVSQGGVFRVGRIELRRSNRAMTLQLPSGRRLVYWSPSLKQRETPWGELRYQLHYFSQNPVTRQWEEFAAYGGLLTENVVQATARDILADALVRLDVADLRPILLVHDETVCETDPSNIGVVTTILSSLPPWTEGLPLTAKVVAGPRYMKGD